MFEKIFIEKNIVSTEKVNKITQFFPNVPTFEIDSIDEYFGRMKKPYLQKRESLYLYLGEKKGQLVKNAPNAYGLSDQLRSHQLRPNDPQN